MEILKCPNHPDKLCLLKTGTKPGPSQGVSFYICTQCKFVKTSKQPASTCSIHEDKTVELQSLVVAKDRKGIRQYFRCGDRVEGKSWCGYKQITEQEKLDSLSPSSPITNNRLEKEGEKDMYVSQMKVKTVESTKRSRHNGDIHKEKENVENGSKQKETVKTTTHFNKASHVKENVVSKQPLSFSDLSKSKDITSPNSQMDKSKTPFQNKSFHQYRDSPNPHRPGPSVHRHRRDSDSSSDSDSNNIGVQDTKNLMQKLSIKDNKNSDYKEDDDDDTKSKSVILIDSDSDSDLENVKLGKASNNAANRSGNDHRSHSTETRVESKSYGAESTAGLTSHGAGENPSQTTSTATGSAVSAAVGGKPDGDPRLEFRKLKEDRQIAVAELNKFQTSLRGIRLGSLPDKGQKLLSRIGSYKQHIASLDKKMIALLQQHGNDVSKEPGVQPSTTSHQKPAFQQQQQPQTVRVYPGTDGSTKTVVVRPHQVSAIGNSTSSQNASTTAMHHNTHVSSGGTQFIQLPEHLTQYFAANPQAMTLYGGRMTAQRLREVGTITTEAIDKIHKQLESCPSESTELSDPAGLRVDLMPHQRQALAWLEWREQEHPAGGILADDMGLGKTLTMISHMMRKKQEAAAEGAAGTTAKEGWLGKNKQGPKSIKKSRATLIVAPASLVHQWAKEIEKRCKSSSLKFLVYHGPNRENNINRLCDNDVVITTYAIVSKEVGVDSGDAEMAVKDEDDDEEEVDKKEGDEGAAQKPKASLPLLLRIGWERIILDEAHDIKNHKSARSRSVCRLRAAYRWALTGTPIQNDLKDMYSLLRFLRFSPFDELKVWKRHIESAKVSTKRLNTLVKALLLRRTKDQTNQSGKPLVELPDKTYENIKLDLSQEEQKIYDKLFQKTQSTVKEYVYRHQDLDQTSQSQSGSVVNDESSSQQRHLGGASGGGSSEGGMNKPKNTGSQILVFLLRLRQCCSHLSLLKAHLETESLETDGIELSLQEQMKGLMLDEGEGEGTSAAVSEADKSDIFEKSSLSTKLSHVMTKLQNLQEDKPTDKSVIVSQWTAMLEIVAQHLKSSKVSYSLIQGNVPPKKRAEIVEDFNKTGTGAKVLLVSLCAGGVGLNLIGGNHLFLLDSHWNPALEAQACDRIYRIGQKKDVKIYRFICKKTIEEKIWMLQQGKLSLAKSVLSGTANKNQKLSLSDLRMLFGV